MGRIKSLNRIIIRRDGKPQPCKEKLLKFGKTSDGYRQVMFSMGKINKTFKIHRLVGIYHVPNPDNLPEVNHKWGEKDDNRACSLEWVTRSGNQKHAFATGLKFNKRGESQWASKLRESDIIAIRELLKANMKQKDIGKIYGVRQSTIYCIKARKIWAWL